MEHLEPAYIQACLELPSLELEVTLQGELACLNHYQRIVDALVKEKTRRQEAGKWNVYDRQLTEYYARVRGHKPRKEPK